MSPAKSDRLRRIMQAAAAEGLMIPAFNIPYLPMVEPTARALRECDAFSMIEVARLELTKFESRSLAHVAEEYNRHADPAVTTLHLDHIPVIDEDDQPVDWRTLTAEGIALGYDSVMIDGSRLPLDDNIAATAEVVAMAHREGILVEAELGAVLGHAEGPMPPYDEIFEKRLGFTEPADARRFVAETDVDWLSVSVGSFHGAISAATKDQPKVPARLDIDRIRELRDATGVPLVLHGGSGVIQSYVDEAFRNGMVKINVATDTRQPYERTLKATGSIADAQDSVADAIRHLIVDVYGIQGSATRLRRAIGEIA